VQVVTLRIVKILYLVGIGDKLPCNESCLLQEHHVKAIRNEVATIFQKLRMFYAAKNAHPFRKVSLNRKARYASSK
jgi:hypothetical protein